MITDSPAGLRSAPLRAVASSEGAPAPLRRGDPAAAGLDVERLDDLFRLVERHIAEGRYPGCQLAIARDGELLVDRTFGLARVAPTAMKATDDTLWLLYSNTKILMAIALWRLADRGAFRFSDRMSEYVPEFARHGKREITILQLITHQAGFPNAEAPARAWHDRKALRSAVCDFTLEWTPGSRVSYHGLSAHWVLAVLIESLTGEDFRRHLTASVIEPLGLTRELFVGLPPSEDGRVSDMHFDGRRIVSPRMLAYALRNHTGDRPDQFMGMPMHRGLGPHLRGTTENIRGLGALASPRTYGHGGVGSSYCWADPESGVSFAYLTNMRAGEPWHTERLDRVSNLVHAAILPRKPG